MQGHDLLGFGEWWIVHDYHSHLLDRSLRALIVVIDTIENSLVSARLVINMIVGKDRAEKALYLHTLVP